MRGYQSEDMTMFEVICGYQGELTGTMSMIMFGHVRVGVTSAKSSTLWP